MNNIEFRNIGHKIAIFETVVHTKEHWIYISGYKILDVTNFTFIDVLMDIIIELIQRYYHNWWL